MRCALYAAKDGASWMVREGEPILPSSWNTHLFASEGSHEHELFTAIIVVVLIVVNYNIIVVMPAARLSNSGKLENGTQLLPVGARLSLIC